MLVRAAQRPLMTTAGPTSRQPQDALMCTGATNTIGFFFIFIIIRRAAAAAHDVVTSSFFFFLKKNKNKNKNKTTYYPVRRKCPCVGYDLAAAWEVIFFALLTNSISHS